MAATSEIAWTDATWNPVVGCEKVSPGCAHCYAETMAKRLRAMALADIDAGKDPGRKRHYIDAVDGKGRWTGKLIPVPESLDDPDKWRKPRMVFVNSMSDLFHESIPFEFVARVWTVMRRCRKHTFQILTKRPSRAKEFLKRCANWEGWITHNGAPVERAYDGDGIIVGDQDAWPLPNVWLGVSAEDQKRADERIPILLDTPAAVRFVSAEPLLGPVDFIQAGAVMATTCACNEPWATRVCKDSRCLDRGMIGALDWIIVGGESGHGARPCDLAWIRSIVEQCAAADVPCFVKQLGAAPYSKTLMPEPRAALVWLCFLNDRKGGDIEEFPTDLRVRQFPQLKA